MATLTITTTGAQDARIVAAFGKYLNLSGDASAAQVKAAVIEFIVDTVKLYERKVAADSAANAVTPITPT